MKENDLFWEVHMALNSQISLGAVSLFLILKIYGGGGVVSLGVSVSYLSSFSVFLSCFKKCE